MPALLLSEGGSPSFRLLPSPAAICNHLLHRRDAVPREMLALILPEKHIAKLDQIREQRIVVIDPGFLVLDLRLQAPALAELLRAHLPLLAGLGRSLPDVKVAHGNLCGARGG